ncbi:peptidoglycan-binding domain-containing protein [Pseudocolwellia sp. HL-MZ19]|uniref:peptidoglycan-binding domain-containing protein n=1 Tax=unclassified Pseudocolwellia TaxID=2848178 RepID=UPI003CE8EAC8
MEKLIRLIIICCISLSFQTIAADKDGKFAVKGAGKQTCASFTEAITNKTTNYYLFGGWVEGFVSSYNRFQPENFDITPWQTTELILALLQTHCASNPEVKFLSATNALIKTLFPIRLSENSNFVKIQVGKSQTYYYQEIINRAKKRLKVLGFIKGDISSAFSQEDAIAVENYQKAIGHIATGVLDQKTLASLFLKAK